MRYRKFGKTGLDTSVVGLGAMRLPMCEDGKVINEDKAIKMIRYALDNGINYLDTAYPYHDEMSEDLVGKALRDGYREKAILIDKSPVWLVKDHGDFQKYLDIQLERLGVESIDIYLMHALNKTTWETINKCDYKTFLKKAQQEGKIKHVGFSFHDEYPLFKEIVDAYDWDMCMIQQNVVDTKVQATEDGIRYAGAKGLAVTIMEPLKGGLLVDPPDEIKDIYTAYDKDRSPVEWGLKWLANYPEVKVVLSGMSHLDHVIENIEIADRMIEASLSDEETKIYDEVREIYNKRVVVKCTDCKYCMPCPSGVDIPENFKLLNRGSIYNTMSQSAHKYQEDFKAEEKADKCTQCGECLSKCPQELNIIQDLKTVDEALSQDPGTTKFKWSS